MKYRSVEDLPTYCGAKTRKGTPCKRKDVYMNGRCRLHGGLSTGPKTEEGKRRSALNGHCPKRKRRKQKTIQKAPRAPYLP